MPSIVNGEKTPVNWRESCLETLFITIVWLVVHVATKRLLSRLHYLESFFKVCAWCRRVKLEDSWLPLEKYLSQGMDVKTTHGICPECKEKHLHDDRRASQ